MYTSNTLPFQGNTKERAGKNSYSLSLFTTKSEKHIQPIKS